MHFICTISYTKYIGIVPNPVCERFYETSLKGEELDCVMKILKTYNVRIWDREEEERKSGKLRLHKDEVKLRCFFLCSKKMKWNMKT